MRRNTRTEPYNRLMMIGDQHKFVIAYCHRHIDRCHDHIILISGPSEVDCQYCFVNSWSVVRFLLDNIFRVYVCLMLSCYSRPAVRNSAILYLQFFTYQLRTCVNVVPLNYPPQLSRKCPTARRPHTISQGRTSTHGLKYYLYALQGPSNLHKPSPNLNIAPKWAPCRSRSTKQQHASTTRIRRRDWRSDMMSPSLSPVLVRSWWSWNGLGFGE